MRKILFYLILIIIFASCSHAIFSVSEKQFPSISLVNHCEYYNKGEHEFKRVGTAFLLKYKNDTFAITAKHILAGIKPDSSKNLTLENVVKTWTMSPLNKEDEIVLVDKLLNEDKNERVKPENFREKDWLVFSIKENKAKVNPLVFREKSLKKGEKLYAIGWTRNMKEGDQRVYEFEFYKTKGTHHLLKKLIIPDEMGGLSGAPVIDEEGKLVGIVSKSEFSFFTMESMLAPSNAVDLKVFLDNYLNQFKKK